MSFHKDLRDCYWFESLSGQQVTRDSLQGEISADVVVIGAGYTGLWTAYHLKRLDPALSVIVLEAEHAGFGASGRNGGWLMGAIEGLEDYLADCDADTRAAGYREVHAIPARALDVLRRENIDCDAVHGGAIYAAARYPEQLAMAQSHLDDLRAAGHSEDDYRWLDRDGLQARVNIAGAAGGIYTPHVAVVQPAKLVTGLANAVERLGVCIFENSRVVDAKGGQVQTSAGRVRAPVIISALEGYGTGPEGIRGTILPFQSGMVVTEPLPAGTWREIGLQGRPALCDYSRLTTYVQRTADDRLVFGARGSYRFGGRPVSRFDGNGPEFEGRRALARRFFPVLEGARFTHAWGGTLGIPRCFAPHVVFDAASGLGTAGGYIGEGVGASFLFGETLAELVLQRETDRTRLPWVLRGNPRRVLRRWEPEPLRWLGFKLAWSIYSWEEKVCARGDAPAWRRKLAQRAAGKVKGFLS